MHEALNKQELMALLEWQVELGADEALGETPINRYEAPPQAPAPAAKVKAAEPVKVVPPTPVTGPDPVQIAQASAASAMSLQDLHAALSAFSHCDLRHGASSLVFSDGQPGARVMIIGEAPGREEDRVGKPFVGRAGQLLDRMFAPIGLDRTHADPAHAIYITNVLPWCPPQNRTPTPQEIAMLRPFVERHIALAAPDVLVLMGNVACEGLLGRKGITRMRGQWLEAVNLPCLPMFHPAYLLRNPAAKREAWADLLSLRARLDALP